MFGLFKKKKDNNMILSTGWKRIVSMSSFVRIIIRQRKWKQFRGHKAPPFCNDALMQKRENQRHCFLVYTHPCVFVK